MRKCLLFLFGLAGIHLIFSGCTLSPLRPKPPVDPYNRTRASISVLIQEVMKRHSIQGISVGLVEDQRVVWAEGFGYADRERQIPATAETIYPAGSIAKLFTILAALQMVEQKRLDLDQPLQSYLPDFSVRSRFSNSSPMTIRTLMTHHSGLPSDRLHEMISRNPVSLSETERGMKEEWTAYPPQTLFSYSNVGIRLLGLAIERISRKDFNACLKESLFHPLKMNQTSFTFDPSMPPLFSKGYKGGWELEEFLLRPLPSPEGPIYSTVHDLGRFIQMIFAGGKVGDQQVVTSETLAEMFRPQNTGIPLDLDFRIGLGWFLNELDIQNGGPVASHGGTLSLFHSYLALLPEHKLGVVVLANSSGAVHAVSRIAEETLKKALEEKTGIRQPGPENAERKRTLPWSTMALNRHVGHYATPLRVFKVWEEGGRLYSRVMGRKVHLIFHAGNRFSLQYRLFGWIPIRLGALEQVTFSLETIQNQNVLVLHQKGKRHLLGQKIESHAVPRTWMKRVGEYELVGSQAYLPLIERAELKFEDPFLMLDVKIPLLGDYGIERLQFAIQPVSDTEAILLGLGRNMGETIQVVGNPGNETLRYSGCEFKKKPH